MQFKPSAPPFLFAALIWVTCPLTSSAQKESTSAGNNRRDSVNAKEITLTKAQQDWVNINYTKLAGLQRSRAKAVAKDNFPNASEAALDAIIAMAGRLAQTTQQDAAALQKEVDQLKAQQRSLINQIRQKEAELAAATALADKVKIQREIEELRASLAKVALQIQNKEKSIAKLQSAQ